VYYELSLTHSSASYYYSKTFSINNERLEFLGDSVLNTVISEYLFIQYPCENEGFLTEMRSKLVKRTFLNEVALKFNFQELVFSNSIKTVNNTNVLGNALEAFIGAVYLDRGYLFSKKFIINKIIIPYANIKELEKTDTNYKGQIIDWAQKKHLRIEFRTTQIVSDKKGYNKYNSEVLINKQSEGCGLADSKKEAEQIAAYNALQKLKGS